MFIKLTTKRGCSCLVNSDEIVNVVGPDPNYPGDTISEIFFKNTTSFYIKETPEQIYNIINGTEEFLIKMDLPQDEWAVETIRLLRTLLNSLGLKDAKDFMEGNKTLQVTKKEYQDLINNFGSSCFKEV